MRLLLAFLMCLVLASPADAARRIRYTRKCSDPTCEMCHPENFVNHVYVGCVACRKQGTPLVTNAPTESALAPTPQQAVADLITLCGTIGLGHVDVFLDVGCGEGALLTTVCESVGCYGIGVEREAGLVKAAWERVKSRRLTRRISLLKTDATGQVAIYRGARVVYMYLPLDTIEAVYPRLDPTSVVISYKHPIPGVRQRRVVVGQSVFYVVERE